MTSVGLIISDAGIEYPAAHQERRSNESRWDDDDPVSTPVTSAHSRCPICGPPWHWWAILLFRISIPAVVVLAMFEGIICLYEIGVVYRYLHEPHPDNDSYYLAALAYLVFFPLLLNYLVELLTVAGCGWVMRAEFYPWCGGGGSSSYRPVVSAATGEVSATVATQDDEATSRLSVPQQESVGRACNEVADRGGVVEGPTSELPVGSANVRRSNCLRWGSCRYTTHLVLAVFLAILSFLNCMWMLHTRFTLILTIPTLLKSVFLLLYLLAVIFYVASPPYHA